MSIEGDLIRKTVDERLKLIMGQREKLVTAFIAETGLLPSQCELVEQTVWAGDSITTLVRIRRRGEL